MSDLEKYRASESERARTDDLLRLIPKNRRSILDIGARDGHFSRLFTQYFDEVTALDLERPAFEIPGVVTVAGDATRLDYPDNAFDCVFCAEVLEHIPAVDQACREVARVARYEIVVGVPYRQDIRLGRVTCRSCGKNNPPWGHVNSFDEKRLIGLFPGMRVLSKSFVGSNREATNTLAAFLMDRGGNPWGTYQQDEGCIHCGSPLVGPESPRPLGQKLCSAAAHRLNRIQSFWTRPHGNWIHLVFSKRTED
jgi:SAM-dependent methyltransferase